MSQPGTELSHLGLDRVFSTMQDFWNMCIYICLQYLACHHKQLEEKERQQLHKESELKTVNGSYFYC